MDTQRICRLKTKVLIRESQSWEVVGPELKFCPLETRDVVLEPSVSPTMPPNGELEKYKVKLVMDDG